MMPDLKMPALTPFIDGSGPVFSGKLFPFVFITIACGAISGFHALVASGTTPKMISRESHVPMIGYGGMLTESFVAMMALISACILTPGIYVAMNSPASIIGTDVVQAAKTISSYGSVFTITPNDLTELAKSIGEETILSRTGGAPTLAVGIATVFSNLLGGKAFMSFWYHFAILFEAVFILTTLDAGTRVGRFILQDLMGRFSLRLGRTDWYPANFLASFLMVSFWGYFLYQGVIDPLGGINTLWPLFGIANQMLAVVALIVGTTILIKMGKKAYAWVTLLPLSWLILVTTTAGYQKIFHEKSSIGFLAAAEKYQKALLEGLLISPAKTMEEMGRIVWNNRLDALLAGFFSILIVIILIDALRVWYKEICKKDRNIREDTL
jgi:carbon starvation protein